MGCHGIAALIKFKFFHDLNKRTKKLGKILNELFISENETQ
jgi:hypothetical protein